MISGMNRNSSPLDLKKESARVAQVKTLYTGKHHRLLTPNLFALNECLNLNGSD